ncbi:DUF3140 domain-containing protein [Solwaraspora sp. WMMD1047]|uniref:DUF3140 domain-containing protein n=1 Tax=Solwaraspora sp. WMMD1047 TaxID=3016102 RepID=UPI00241735EB|nr:DUF3140 domain-containing protein [Solwaraspora sp. WMMD1047]MDG4831192.1 DUF3140 domain-containing protein [Solwaraspora sp. WMMD1047]
MVRDQRVEPDVELLWQDFHSRVTMSSEQLRTWLLTQGSGERAFTEDPDLDLPEPGRQILAVLRKRKVDLTRADIEVMRQAVDRIDRLLRTRPSGAAEDDQWRHALLDLGHDPLNES